MDFRHEWKHVISPSDLMALRIKLQTVMSRDIHASEDGSYKIRSLYFDNLYDKALREKTDGVNHREKFRIRLYNDEPSLIFLEKKSKHNGLSEKKQEILTFTEASLLAENNYFPLSDTQKPLLKELIFKMMSEGLRPQTIVDYTRDPFVYGPGNVRVTLDYNIRTGLRCTDLLNPECITIPVPDNPAILEVKWDAFLPSVIRDLIQTPTLRSTAFSKYAASRLYE